jgi:hypothetical protein
MGFLDGQDRRLAFLDRVARASNRVGWIGVDNMSGHQQVEQHANRGQVINEVTKLRHPAGYPASRTSRRSAQVVKRRDQRNSSSEIATVPGTVDLVELLFNAVLMLVN